MSIEKIVDLLGLPKALLDGARSLFNRLLGPAVDETGLLFADKVKFRRFCNQVKVVAAANEILREANIVPNAVALRTLFPLLEKASLEEDSGLQEMWSNLLARAATSDVRAAVQRLAVEVLGSISPREAVILEHVYELYQKERQKQLADPKRADRGDPPAEFVFFRPSDGYKKAGVERRDGDLLVDNLLRLGILRFEVPEFEDGQNTYPDFVHLTELGLGVLKECMEPPEVV